jgi:hypothetical protein
LLKDKLLREDSLTPEEGVFYNGQIFDAYVFATNLIKSGTRDYS